MAETEKTPFIHRTRNKPVRVRFIEENVIIDLADGRAIVMPLYFFPRLEAASDAQRKDYRLHHVSVSWEELDEGIDLIAMLTGLYPASKTELMLPTASAAAT